MFVWLAGCGSSGGPEADPAVTNETATKVREQLQQEAAEARKAAEEEGLPEETIKETQKKIKERQTRLEEQNSASPHKSLTNAEIEAMMDELLKAYEASPSANAYDKLMATFQDPVVKQYYDNNGPEVKARRKVIVARVKELKASE